MTDETTLKFPEPEISERWSKNAVRVFKAVYNDMLNNQDRYSHPSTVLRAQVHWKTTAWNSAWMAAEAADGNLDG